MTEQEKCAQRKLTQLHINEPQTKAKTQTAVVLTVRPAGQTQALQTPVAPLPSPSQPVTTAYPSQSGRQQPGPQRHFPTHQGWVQQNQPPPSGACWGCGQMGHLSLTVRIHFQTLNGLGVVMKHDQTGDEEVQLIHGHHNKGSRYAPRALEVAFADSNTKADREPMINVKIEGKSIPMLADTGATYACIKWDYAPPLPMSEKNVKITQTCFISLWIC
uniref:Retropepsins domain-containing protein n=1 Tax=Nothobranchius korthausae TaxID=1143690 RepID=A0A1A8FUS9_9TELE